MRDRIMMKAIEKMNDRSVKFTMADLARELGVSKRTLYEQFSSKEELIATIIDAMINDLRQQDQEILQSTDMDFVGKFKAMLLIYPRIFGSFNERIIEDIQRYFPREWAKIEQFQDEKWQNLEEIIRQGIDEGVLKPINPVVLRKIFIGTNRELLDYQFLVQNGINLKEALKIMAEVLMFGVVIA